MSLTFWKLVRRPLSTMIMSILLAAIALMYYVAMPPMERRRNGGPSSRPEFSIYVGNLPTEIDKLGLEGIFRRFGRVRHTYIPSKVGKYGRFGFIRFWREPDALRAIQQMNQRLIRGRKILVSRSRRWENSQQLGSGRNKSKKVWVRKKNQENNLFESEERGLSRRVIRIKGDQSERMTNWLKRSLICVSEEPKEMQTILDVTREACGPCARVTILSVTQIIVTFQSKEEMEAIVRNPGNLLRSSKKSEPGQNMRQVRKEERGSKWLVCHHMDGLKKISKGVYLLGEGCYVWNKMRRIQSSLNH